MRVCDLLSQGHSSQCSFFLPRINSLLPY